MPVYVFSMFCPVCDRKKISETSQDDALEQVKVHVSKNHPEYDPNWHETYPERPISNGLH